MSTISFNGGPALPVRSISKIMTLNVNTKTVYWEITQQGNAKTLGELYDSGTFQSVISHISDGHTRIDTVQRTRIVELSTEEVADNFGGMGHQTIIYRYKLVPVPVNNHDLGVTTEYQDQQLGNGNNG